jgi:hypothetical protein
MKLVFERGLIAALAMMSLYGLTATAQVTDRYYEDSWYAAQVVKTWAREEFDQRNILVTYQLVFDEKLNTLKHNQEIVEFIRKNPTASKLNPALDVTGREVALKILKGGKVYAARVCVWISRAPLGSLPIPYAKNNTTQLVTPDAVVTLTIDATPANLYRDISFEEIRKRLVDETPGVMAGEFSPDGSL